MPKNINIIYDVKQNVSFSFLKLFFEMIGVWVTAEGYNSTHISVDCSHVNTVYLLSYESESLIMDRMEDNIFYVLRGKYKDKRKLDRPDICRMDFRDEKELGCLIRWFFRNSSDQKELLLLLKYYYKQDVWKYLWLFQEFAVEEGDLDYWKDGISSMCDVFTNNYEKKQTSVSSPYMKYAGIYLQYIKVAVERHRERNEWLLQKGIMMLKDEASDNGPALNILLAKICGMSFEWNRWTLPYYKSAFEYAERLGYSKTCELLYKIGRIYEKDYKNWDKAIEYYHKSYEKNHLFYRTLYKMGIEAEKSAKWRDAENYYKIVEDKMKTDWRYDQITIKSLEYLCKARNRLGAIYKIVMPSAFLEQVYREKIYKIKSDLQKVIDELEYMGNLDEIKKKEVLERFSKLFYNAKFDNSDILAVMKNLKKKLEKLDC